MIGTDAPILLVEDDVSVRSSLSEFLEDHGHKTCCAGTLCEGWEMLLRCRPALCLLDLNLPDGNGIELLRRIAERGIDVQVIILTAMPLKHLHPGAAAPALAAWMTKPVAPGELLEAVQSALNGARSLEGIED